MSKLFIDTNVLLYAHDPRYPDKKEKAITTVGNLLETGTGVLSTQVLQEFSANALGKFRLKHDVLLRQLEVLGNFEIILISPEIIRRAVEITVMYSTSYWDACIIAAAESARCETILSEDLNTGQYYAGVKIENPFI